MSQTKFSHRKSMKEISPLNDFELSLQKCEAVNCSPRPPADSVRNKYLTPGEEGI